MGEMDRHSAGCPHPKGQDERACPPGIRCWRWQLCEAEATAAKAHAAYLQREQAYADRIAEHIRTGE